jgi:hypothetical protein
MRLTRPILFAACLATRLSAQSDPGPEAGLRDTMPEHVVAKGTDAFNRQDAQTLASLYDPETKISILSSDSTAGPRPAGSDSVLAGIRRYWSNQKQRPHLKVVKRISTGPFVVDVYELSDDAGRRETLDIYEVRHGHIVHEWWSP